jgi:hypothetical protein
MRRTFLGLAVLVVLAGACGPANAEMDDCGDVADASIDLIQDVMDELSALPPEQQQALVTDFEFSAGPELEARREVINDRADELNCINLKTLITERAPRLINNTASAIGQFIMDGINAGGDMLQRIFGADD